MQPSTESQVWVHVHYTVNLGNYESVKVELGESFTLGQHNVPVDVRKQIFDQLKSEVVHAAEQLRREVRRQRRPQPQSED